MASNRLRALRNVGTRLNNTSATVGQLTRRPAPRKLASNLITTGNLRRYIVEEPVVAPNAITREKIEDGAVGEDEIDDGAVTEDKLDIDAVTGKNVTSCLITDSDIEDCRFTRFEGSELTVTDTFSLTNGTIDQVEITGTSTLTGSEVVLDGCTLQNCIANEIIGEGGLNLTSSGDIGITGGGVVISGGDSLMTFASGNFGVSSGGSGFQISGGSMNVSVSNFQAFTVNGLSLNTRNEYIALEARVAALETGKADAGHTHPGL